jgi:hypothetical protein
MANLVLSAQLRFAVALAALPPLQKSIEGHDVSNPTLTHVARSYGAMVAAWFGAAWLCAWRSAAHAPVFLTGAVLAGAALVSSVAYLQARRFRRIGPAVPGGQRARSMRFYWIVNVAQWLLIFGAAAALGASGHPRWIVAAVILVVGLHFIPLGRIFADRLHYATGAALVVLACSYPLLSPSGPQDPIGLLGAGIILSASAIVAVAANAVFERARQAHG